MAWMPSPPLGLFIQIGVESPAMTEKTAIFALLSFGTFLGCDIPETARQSTEPTQQSTSSIHQDTSSTQAEPAASSSIDLFESLGGMQDGNLTIHCYGFSRVESREVIIEQSKALVKTMKPNYEVAYIFNKKKGVEDFIEHRQMIIAGDKLAKERGTVFLHPDYSPKLKKWMRDSHFAQISYMNQGSAGSRWELIPTNKVAERVLNSQMESIPLSETVP
jgi:hypothetical protein